SRTLIQLIAIGIGLALTLNVLRISVMVLAAVYWGEAAFEFWHGTIGGQIFSGVLFTLYYSAIQPILDLND
ncbi:MAG TPA: archaeosortase/exosortase family protein, partial [Leptolyngbya sp.]|nr:archaeosortase/exosortase family protein [Leptolyngbya sp.]